MTWDGTSAADAGVIRRATESLRSVSTGATAAEQNVLTVTIPSPVNGRRYKVTAVTHPRNSLAGAFSTLRLRRGFGAVTGGDVIVAGYKDHRAANRSEIVEFSGEFIYTNVTGSADYRIVLTITGGGGTSMVEGSSELLTTLTLDEIL